MPVKDLAVGIAVTAKTGEAVVELRRLKSANDDLTQSVTDAKTPTKALGDTAKGSADDLAKMGDAADGVTLKSRALSLVADTLGIDLGNMAGGARGAAGALGEAGAAAGGLSTGTALALGGVVALGAGFAAAVGLASGYAAEIKEVEQQLALAGNVTGETAEQFRASAAQIAADTGTAFDDVEAAQLKLVGSGKFFGAQVEEVTRLGAGYAATFGGDVTDATQTVADAINGLATGDIRALDEGFGFLDVATQKTIATLIAAGDKVGAVNAFMAALNLTVAGGKGSSVNAFTEVSGAFTDYVGSLANSIPIIKSVQALLNGLTTSAIRSANALREATAERAKSRLSDVSSDIGDLQSARDRFTRLTPGAKGFNPFDASISRLSKERAELVSQRFQLAADRESNKPENRAKLEKFKSDFEASQKVRTPRTARKAGKSDAEREAEKREREAKAAAKELAADLASLTRAYDPLDAAQDKHARQLALIAKLQLESAGASRISAEQAKLFTEAATQDLDDAKRADLDKLNRQFGVLGDNAARYAETLRDIAALEKRSIGDGGIAPFEADQLRAAAKREKIEADIARITKDRLKDAASAGAKTLRDEGIASAQAVAKALGGNLGREASDFIGLLRGAQTGDFTSVSGKLGGILTLISGSRDGADKGGVAKGAADFAKTLSDAVKKPLEKIFGDGGLFSKSLGKELGTVGEVLGNAIAAASFGKGVTNLFGIKGSKTGAAVGSTIGKAIPIPGGEQIGAILGSITGGLFKKPKSGSAALSFADGGFSAGTAVGNSASLRGQATALAGSLSNRLETIAETLGGILSGKGSVSVGFRKGQAVVDPTGQNRTKGAGVLKFGKGEEGQARAEAFAFADLLADGAISGLSDRVASALRSSTDIEKGVREAVKVDELEQLLAGFGAGTKRALVDFERQAKERLRIATKFGFDVVKVEEETAKQRKALNDQLLEERTGSLKALLDDFRLGDRSGGSLADRRAALLGEIKGLEGSAAGDANTASKIAELLSQFDAVSLEANGTAGGQFASDRAEASDIAKRIIAQATAEIEAAAAAARANAGTTTATDKLISAGNATLGSIASGIDELAGQTAEMVAALRKIINNTAGGGSGSNDPFAGALNVGRNVV